jgi:hypothetical protein
VKAATKARLGSGFRGSAAGARTALGRALHITKCRMRQHQLNSTGFGFLPFLVLLLMLTVHLSLSNKLLMFFLFLFSLIPSLCTTYRKRFFCCSVMLQMTTVPFNSTACGCLCVLQAHVGTRWYVWVVIVGGYGKPWGLRGKGTEGRGKGTNFVPFMYPYPYGG